MKKLLIHTVLLFLLLAVLPVKAQVLFNEDFDSYPAGHLNTDYTNTTPLARGWLVSRGITGTSTVMVTAETGKGNVITITSNGASNGAASFRQVAGVIDVLWNNRKAGNNICKFEFEFYGTDVINVSGELTTGTDLINVGFQTQFYHRIIGNYLNTTSSKTIVLKNYNTTPFPYDTWITAEMFIDYNTNNVYFYIPTLNLQASGTFLHNRVPDGLSFGASLNSTSVVKLDNIKLSALQTLPSYLSTSEQLAAKFNLYPNPATTMVTITNNENRLVNQIAVYDTTGKLITTQNYNNETELQLNVENLAGGTYLLHLQTNEGTAVKKLVKK